MLLFTGIPVLFGEGIWLVVVGGFVSAAGSDSVVKDQVYGDITFGGLCKSFASIETVITVS
jgi:hypothetical protein